MYEVRLIDGFQKDLKQLKKENKKYLHKLEYFIAELKKHPKSGTGKVEQLKYQNEEYIFSRRISKKH